MSDLVLGLFGSIAGAESVLIGFTGDSLTPSVVMAEAPRGTAPALRGKNLANPRLSVRGCANSVSD
jgi:isocitrate dehydrogenase